MAQNNVPAPLPPPAPPPRRAEPAQAQGTAALQVAQPAALAGNATAYEVVNGKVTAGFAPQPGVMKRFRQSPAEGYHTAGKAMTGYVGQIMYFWRGCGAVLAVVLEVVGAAAIGLALESWDISAWKIALGVFLIGLGLDLALTYGIYFSERGMSLLTYSRHQLIALDAFDQTLSPGAVVQAKQGAQNGIKDASRRILTLRILLGSIAILKFGSYVFGMSLQAALADSLLVLVGMGALYAAVAFLHATCTGAFLTAHRLRAGMLESYTDWSNAAQAVLAPHHTTALPAQWAIPGEDAPRPLAWKEVKDDLGRIAVRRQADTGGYEVTFPAVFLTDRDIKLVCEAQDDKRAARCLLHFLIARQVEDVG